MSKFLTVIIVSCLLTSCMSMSFKGMYKMATLDPLLIEPSELKLALRTDQVVEVATGSVVMRLEYSSPAHEGLPAVERKHKFDIAVERFDIDVKVEKQHSPRLLMAHKLPNVLLEGILPTEQVTIMYLNKDDAQAMAETQRIVKQYKGAGAKGKGMFSFNFNQSCLLNTDNMKTLEVDLFLKTAKDEEYFMFFDDFDVIEHAQNENVDLKNINQCATR